VKRANKTKDNEKEEDKMKSQRTIACKHCKNNLYKITRNSQKVSKMKQTAPYTKQKFNGGGGCCVTNESYLEYEKQEKYFEGKLKEGGDHQ
jgi:hypothetical protein